MNNGPLRLSLSQPYVLRWSGITYTLNGQLTDPRALFTPQLQLLVPGVTSFVDTWGEGEWEAYAPPTGPYAATFLVGPGQTPSINPGAAGTYSAIGRLYQAVGERPTFTLRTIVLEAP